LKHGTPATGRRHCEEHQVDQERRGNLGLRAVTQLAAFVYFALIPLPLSQEQKKPGITRFLLATGFSCPP